MGSKWGSFKSVWPTLVAGPVVVSVVVVFLAGSASAVVSAREDLVARTGPWTLEGKADLHDSGALDLRIRSIAGVSPAFDLVRRLLSAATFCS